MTKRILVVVLALLALVALPAIAQEVIPVHTDLAAQIPAEAQLFVSFRLDDGIFNDLETAADLFFPLVPEDIRPQSVSSFLDEQAFADLGFTTADFQRWAGNRAAVALLPAPADDPFASEPAVFIMDLEDRAGMEDALVAAFGGTLGTTEINGFTAYIDAADNIAYWFSDDTFIFTDADSPYTPSDPIENPMSATANFQRALFGLPEGGYNAFVYIDPTLLNVPAGENNLLALGFGLLDGRSLIIDSVSFLEAAPFVTQIPTVDPAFARFIPDTVDGYIHQNDLSALYGVLRATLAAQGDTTSLPQFEQGLASVGFDLETDLFSWADDDFALAYSAETLTMVRLIEDAATRNDAANLPLILELFDMGLILETSDPVASEAFRAKLTGLAAPLFAGDETVSVEDTTIAGAPVTVVNLEIPVEPEVTLPLEIVIGGNDEVFVIGTRNMAEQVFSGAPSVMDTDDYAEAQGYTLPDPTSYLYTNNEGLLVSVGTIPALALLGPAIGNVFEEIIAGLEAAPNAEPTATPTLSPTPATVPGDSLTVQITTEMLTLLSSGSSTSTFTEDGLSVGRIVMSLDPGE